jgi:L,D-peptidoglycan transpeptidase YkuD (ErfK/YbiS/YcfS/YnhG family)
VTRFDDLVITRWGARFQGLEMPCAIGRGGIGVKGGEGDGITPRGTFQIMGCGYRPERIGFDAPNVHCQPISLTDVWSDDPSDPDYNHSADMRTHRFSHERLRRADPLYDIFVILDYNFPDAEAGKGSAIFLHKWRKPRHPTEGCVAFQEDDLVSILTRWTPKSRVVIR